MELHLQNVRTGETVKLTPQRTLIGTADHATIRLEFGPYLAALAVRYPNGWAVFGLSDDASVTYNRRPLQPTERITPKRGDLLTIGDERFTFLAPGNDVDPELDAAPPACFVYVTNPDGMEECRAVDHDLLFGRLEFCHVQLGDTRLSRLAALLASHNGEWYIHTLSKNPIGRNHKAVNAFKQIADGDELLIGPLVVRVEIRSGVSEPPRTPPASVSDSTVNMRRPAALSNASPASATDFAETTDDGNGPLLPESGPDLTALRTAAQDLEQWLRNQNPAANAPKGGLSGWLGAQRDKLKRFWLDTPETTAARSLRSAGRMNEAFTLLDRAIRVRPESPELLRELYRLYEAIGFTDLCLRPLRQIEKLAEVRGAPDTWVLEALAKLCERLARERPSMIDRAVHYWHKLEAATGESTSKQRTNALALRALYEGGYAGASGDGS